MAIDGDELFGGYRTLVEEIDRAFLRVKALHPDLVRCAISCCDCCHAFFELTAVEAVYLNYHFERSLQGYRRREILRRARKAERLYRQVHERMRLAVSVEGAPQEVVMDRVARERVACPLLNERNRCDLYPYRPITCRVYGIPTLVGGAARTCGRSGFRKGGSYPTLNLDGVQGRLVRLSEELVRAEGANACGGMRGLISVSRALMAAFGSTADGPTGEAS